MKEDMCQELIPGHGSWYRNTCSRKAKPGCFTPKGRPSCLIHSKQYLEKKQKKCEDKQTQETQRRNKIKQECEEVFKVVREKTGLSLNSLRVSYRTFSENPIRYIVLSLDDMRSIMNAME